METLWSHLHLNVHELKIFQNTNGQPFVSHSLIYIYIYICSIRWLVILERYYAKYNPAVISKYEVCNCIFWSWSTCHCLRPLRYIWQSQNSTRALKMKKRRISMNLLERWHFLNIWIVLVRVRFSHFEFLEWRAVKWAIHWINFFENLRRASSKNIKILIELSLSQDYWMVRY